MGPESAYADIISLLPRRRGIPPRLGRARSTIDTGATAGRFTNEAEPLAVPESCNLSSVNDRSMSAVSVGHNVAHGAAPQ